MSPILLRLDRSSRSRSDKRFRRLPVDMQWSSVVLPIPSQICKGLTRTHAEVPTPTYHLECNAR